MRCVFCRPQGQGALRICEDDGLHGGHSFIGVRLRVCVYVCMYVCMLAFGGGGGGLLL